LVSPIIIRVRNYKAIDEVEVLLGKVVLYGPNGAGKSSFMEAAAYILTASNSIGGRELLSPQCLREGFEVGIVGLLSLSRRGWEYVLRVPEGEYPSADFSSPAITMTLRNVLRSAGVGPLEKVAWIDAVNAYVAAEGFEGEYSFGFRRNPRLPLPHIVRPGLLDTLEEIEDDTLRVLEVSRVYLDYDDKVYVKEAGKSWIPLSDIAYGLQKALTMMICARYTQAVFVEAFEAGLHGDLASELLNYLDETCEVAYVETHSGALVARAVRLGWRAYYLEEGKVRKEIAEVSDLRDVDLYRKELEAMTA